MLSIPVLVRFLAVVVVARFIVSLVDPNFARFVSEVGGDAEDAGRLLAAEAAMHLFFMPLWGRYSDRMGHRRTFALCALGVAAAWFGQAEARGLAALTSFRLLNGIFLCGIVPAAYGLAARESSRDRRGSVMGVVFLCIALSHASGSMAGGEVLNLLEFRPLMLGVGMVQVVLAGLALAESIRARRLLGQRSRNEP
jgi:MFS family permease